MAWPFSKQVNENSNIINLDYTPTLSEYKTPSDVSEAFKGEVEQKTVKFPTELGEEHPFDFKILESLYKKFGFFTAVVDKYVDFVVGPGFYVKCEENEQAKKIIENFIQDVNFDTLLRQWIKEGLVKGNGFMEIGGDGKSGINGLKVLNANYMYVKRDNKGKVEGYNQYKGAFNKIERNKIIPFDPINIAHFPFNIVGDCAYGMGIGYAALVDVNNTIQNEKDSHMIINRKANSPMHAKLGRVDGNTKIIPKPEDVVKFGQKMETMSNKTEWATDDLVDIKVIDFGNIGEKFSAILEYDMNKLIYIFQIPGVLLGMANIPEGLARVQMEAFQRRIQSIQAEVEKVVEEKIFKRILNAGGLDVHVEFEWGTPSIMEIEGRMRVITELIKSPTTSPALKNVLEDELVDLMKLDKDIWEQAKTDAEEERKREEERQQPLVPGQNAGFPQKPVPKEEQKPLVKNIKPQENITPIIDKFISYLEKKDSQVIEQPKQLTPEEILKPVLELIAKQEERTKEMIMQLKEEKKEEKLHGGEEEKKVVPKKKSKKKNSLLPKFKISRKTESVEKSDIKESVKPEKKTKKVISEIHNFDKDCKHCEESWNDINDIEEWVGFKYKDYVKQILNALKTYNFGALAAGTDIELEAGYLSQAQIDKLRKVLEDGFSKGMSMSDMAKKVESTVGIKDLYRLDETGNLKKGASGLPILQKSKEARAIGIVRSEVTKMANQGAVDYYKENGIEKVTWIASFGNRTCPDCEAMNGQVFTIGEQPEMPLHSMCRCTYAPMVDIK